MEKSHEIMLSNVGNDTNTQITSISQNIGIDSIESTNIYKENISKTNFNKCSLAY